MGKLFGRGKATATTGEATASPAAHSDAKSGGRQRQPHNRKSWDLSRFDVPPVEGRTRFHDLGLSLELMQAIADLNFEYCSPIQAQVLPYTLDGYDAIGKAFGRARPATGFSIDLRALASANGRKGGRK